jgi:hypothetical protein
MVRDSGEPLAPPGVPLTEGLLLDELAVVRTSPRRTLDSAVEVLRSGGLGGVLVAVLGAIDVDEAERLARLRTGSAVCVAVVLDSDSWAPMSPRVRAAAVATHDDVCHLLAAAGWRVLPVAHGTPLEQVWPLAGGATAVLTPLDRSPCAAAPLTGAVT